MNKIFIIIQREYLSRVKKKSFLLLTFLTPLFIAGIYAFMFWMMTKDDTETRTIGVINESTLSNPVESTEYTSYEYLKNISFEEGKKAHGEKGLLCTANDSEKHHGISASRNVLLQAGNH